MSAEWICDGCGKREPGVPSAEWGWMKPRPWFEKTVFEDDEFGRARVTAILSACSRACIEIAAKKAGVHSLVLPV